LPEIRHPCRRRIQHRAGNPIAFLPILSDPNLSVRVNLREVHRGEAMIDVTQDAVQVLLDHPKGQGMIVSCYADTSMTGELQWLWSQHLKNGASAIEQQLTNDH
jgi:hypothetical protein